MQSNITYLGYTSIPSKCQNCNVQLRVRIFCHFMAEQNPMIEKKKATKYITKFSKEPNNIQILFDRFGDEFPYLTITKNIYDRSVYYSVKYRVQDNAVYYRDDGKFSVQTDNSILVDYT